ncbi:MAG: hypothetical protein F4153_11270 [Acidimicrobiia bacterium]|nr:hypothetical protein [Acidimicrobiia bacterium]
MPINEITHDDDGVQAAPSSPQEWDGWVSSSATRNHVLGDPLMDWLDRHGEAKGFVRDEVDERTDYKQFIMRKGLEFERAVLGHLRGLGVGTALAIGDGSGGHREAQDLDLAVATFQAMDEGVAIIEQGVLWDPQHSTYGRPDLLVRSDVAASLFPGSLSQPEASIAAPGLGIGDLHYVVVDIKFITLDLLSSGGLGNSTAGSNLAYKVQLHIYNRALARLQGYLPPRAFLLGRGWKQGTRASGDSCMDKLAFVEHHEAPSSKALSERADQAADWVREVRSNGHLWDALPEPSREELRPNAAGDHGDWKSAVKDIVERTGELTALWQVSVNKRREANAMGIASWQDARATPENLGVTGPSLAPRLHALLEANRSQPPEPCPPKDLTAVRPSRIEVARSQWAETPPLEFFVDFETVSNLDDDFSNIPLKGGQPLIFMIGCGHIENGRWHFECFTADQLAEPEEAAIIDRWHVHMAAVRDRVSPGADPRAIHWAHHERTEYNTARDRHPDKNWETPNWFDLLNEVVKPGTVVVRGAHNFGLKSMANAMHKAGLIDTNWTEGPADGQGAMVGAWTCQRDLAQGRAQQLIDLELMQQIRSYNEVDCKVMFEILQYLRHHH